MISIFGYCIYFFYCISGEFTEILIDPVTSFGDMWLGIGGLLIAAWLHATSFFFLLGNIGVVSCGMVKGAQTGRMRTSSRDKMPDTSWF